MPGAAAQSAADAPGSQRPTRGRLLLLGALSGFGPLSLDMYLPGLPSVSHDLHAAAAATQLTITACMLGLAAGQLVAGPLSDARGRRGPLLAGLLAYIASSAACALAPSVAALVALRLIQGMAGGAGIVIARAVVRDLSGGATAARLFALLAAITGVVPVLAPLIGGQVLLVASWRGVFVVLAVIGIPLLAGAVLLLPETLPPEGRHGGGLRVVFATFGRLVRDRGYAPYAVSFSLSFAAMFAYISGSSFVLEDIYGVSPQLFSVVFATNSAGLIALSFIGGRAVDRLGAPRLLRRGLVAVAVASLAALVVTITHAGLGWLLVCFFVLPTANGLVLPSGTTAAMAAQSVALGAASALLGVGQFLAGAIVAPLVGLAGGHDALPMALVMAVAGSTALLVDLLLTRSPASLTEPG